MKAICRSSLCLAFFCGTLLVQAQGTFQNLNFEAANPSGYSPNSQLPVGLGLPGWIVTFSSPGVGTNTATTVWYDVTSLAGALVSINDTNTGFGFVTLQGRYSAYLAGGLSDFTLRPTYSTISQTAVVPIGTLSLLMNVNALNGFIVTLGGQTLNMVPVQTYPSYTQYGADVSAFAGQTACLSITAPPTSVPNEVSVDGIVFSSDPIPEPATSALLALGALGLAWRSLRRKAKQADR